MIEAEIGDYNEDDSIDVHNVLLFIIIVCFEVYQPKNQGKELKQKKIMQVDVMTKSVIATYLFF